MSQLSAAPKSAMQKILDMVERVGNLVPHPVIIFLTLIALVVALSHILYLSGVSVTADVIAPQAPATAPDEEPDDGTMGAAYDTGQSVHYETLEEKNYDIQKQTIAVRSLLTSEGIRFIYVSLIPSFMGFTAVGLMIAIPLMMVVSAVNLRTKHLEDLTGAGLARFFESYKATIQSGRG